MIQPWLCSRPLLRSRIQTGQGAGVDPLNTLLFPSAFRNRGVYTGYTFLFSGGMPEGSGLLPLLPLALLHDNFLMGPFRPLLSSGHSIVDSIVLTIEVELVAMKVAMKDDGWSRLTAEDSLSTCLSVPPFKEARRRSPLVQAQKRSRVQVSEDQFFPPAKLLDQQLLEVKNDRKR